MRSSTQKSSRFSCRRCGNFRTQSSKSRRFLPAATRNKPHAVILRGNIILGDSAMQTAKVVWTGGQKFRAISPSGHTIHLDSDRTTNEGPGPMELLLMALGACTATDIVIILEKKRQKVDWLEVICSGERGQLHPRYGQSWRF